MEARILGPEDEAVLIAAALADEELAIPPERARRLLTDPLWVAAVALDPEPVGLAYGHVLRLLDADSLLLYSIGVAGAHRRKGAGRAMIEALKRYCQARALFEMWVLTNRSNGPAMRLYASAGGYQEADDVVMFEWPTPGVDRGAN